MNKDDICCVCHEEEWGLPVTECCRRRCHEVCQKDGCCNSMPKKLENVCLVIDMEGFIVKKAFLCRELGWRSCTGERGSWRYRMPCLLCDLSVKDKRTADYVTNRVSGLPFDARPTEGASGSDGAPGDVVALYRKYRTKTMGVIGYKGGHVEKDLLERLGIPSVNLEEFGCPKFERLTASDFNPVEGCGFHVRQSHCAMVECEAFFSWLTKHKEKHYAPL